MFQHSVIFAFCFLLTTSFVTALDKRQDSHITVIHLQKPVLSLCCIKKTFCNALYFTGFKRSAFIILCLAGQHFSKKSQQLNRSSNFIEVLVKCYWSCLSYCRHSVVCLTALHTHSNYQHKPGSKENGNHTWRTHNALFRTSVEICS